ncbi:MAG: pyridoxal phosphate-dependent aminotransferase [Bacteroidetes bacterium]|nr:pyridoxal phosphate-dependent aminotransferase [Bacteroidota bacterium]
MEKRYTFSEELINKTIKELNITDLGTATIGEVARLASTLEKETGVPFIRMDQGAPGFDACKIGIEAEKKALDTNVASKYPSPYGVGILKKESSIFIKAFLNIDISPRSCIPTTGSVTASFGSMIACSQREEKKDTILFLDPGFPIHKAQLNITGTKYLSFDIYNFRGEALIQKIEKFLAKGNICAILYSNPNNPAWVCLTEKELKQIGALADKYDVTILEDLAYFGMDYRTNFGKPFEKPYIPTIAKYTDNYILMLSASKIFSYAGQRMAICCISDKLFEKRHQQLAKRYNNAGIFGDTLVNSILYMITSGATHTTQYGYAEMLKSATDGKYNFVEAVKGYAERTEKMKHCFEKHGFHVVYNKDIDEQISDGFFFTIGYKNMNCAEIMKELLHYGISSITLSSTGSEENGIRACSSQMVDKMFPILEERLYAFELDNKE